MARDIKPLLESRVTHIKHVVSAHRELIEIIKKIPKHELHVHLGGSIRRKTIVELAQKNHVPLPVSPDDFLKTLTPLSLFAGDQLWELFHRTYQWYWSCVQSCDDLERITFEFLEDSYRQGVIHSEFTVSGSYLMRTFPFDEWVHAISSGIREAQKRYPIKAAAILDISRRSGPENALKNVKQVIESNTESLCGIGMGGDEVQYPHRLFIEAFRLARSHHISSTVHVAEFRSGETTISAIEDLKPNRLGHALTTIQSENAYRVLKSSGLHVESCPLCNYVGGMGGIDTVAEHPIRRYYEDGVPISINTDDPEIFGFNLIDNYILLMKEAGFGLSDFEKINHNAAHSVFV